MSSPFANTIASLVRHRGVLGALVVGEGDGIVVDADVQAGIDGQALAALAAALYRRARLSARAAGLGAVNFLQLDAERGHVCVAGRDGLVLVTVAASPGCLAIVRTAMLQLVETLS